MYVVRRFAVRHSRFFQRFYDAFEQVIVMLDPLFARVGYEKLETSAATMERSIKSVLFDCQMCGQCALSSTGMSCPMNCPKQLRNGPCGGVRPGGMCEVKPQMRCVWVEAWDGASRMEGGLDKIGEPLPPVDRSLKGTSSWLRVAREKAQEQRDARASAEASLALAGTLGSIAGSALGEGASPAPAHAANHDSQGTGA